MAEKPGSTFKLLAEDMDEFASDSGTIGYASGTILSSDVPLSDSSVQTLKIDKINAEEITKDPCSPSSGGFTEVETPQVGHDTFGDDTTAEALEACKKTVLRPYNIFLQIIAWRRLHPSAHDIRTPIVYRICNILWPLVLTVLLITSCVTQILVCFGRDQIPFQNKSENYRADCSNHVLSAYVILDILLISAYLYGMFIFRFKLSEHLSTFTETVFLGIISRTGVFSPKKLIISLQLLLICGLAWIIFSFCVSIVRIFAYHLHENNVEFEFLPGVSTAGRIILISVSMLGFIVFDVAYTSVVINYAIQCQLMIYYIYSICTRINNKEWDIDQAIKEIHNARQFLSKLNSHLSRATGIMLFVFLTSAVLSMYGLQKLESSSQDIILAAVAGVLGVVQWSLWFFLPLVQAARVTHSGYWLHKTALEIRSRPFSYRNAPQLDLDSFVLYATNVKVKAKIVSVPISPSFVIGGFFILGFTLFLVFQLDNYRWAPWL